MRVRRLTLRSAQLQTVVVAAAVLLVAPSQPTRGSATSFDPIRVAVRGIDGSGWWIGGTDAPGAGVAQPFTALGGVVTGAPAVAAVTATISGPATPYYFATGTDHNVWVRSESTGWAPLTHSPVYCTSGPAAASYSEVFTQVPTVSKTIAVGCRGIDGALWYAIVGLVSADSSVLPSIPISSWATFGGQVVDAPAIAPVYTPAGGKATVFVNGTDGNVYTHEIHGASNWVGTSWRCNGHLAATAPQQNETLFACSGADDHALYVTAKTTGAWVTPVNLGGTLVGGPGMAADSTWTVFATGTDHSLWQRTMTGTWCATPCVPSFGPWTSLGGYLTRGPIGAAMLSTGVTVTMP